MKRQVQVRRCQGWNPAARVGEDGQGVVQCPQPATQDGVRCPFHWGQKPVEWMMVTIDD